jgi:Rnl2 family RNA ligase
MFKKFHSLENHYRTEIVQNFFLRYPELKGESFIINEKIHGANFSVTFHNCGRLQFSKRSGIVTDNFYNYKNAFNTPNAKMFIETMISFCASKQRTIQFVGELFGANIQKGIYYGPNEQWRWFGIYEHFGEEAKFLSHKEENDLFDEIKREYPIYSICNLYVPTIGIFYIKTDETFLEMLNRINIDQNSRLTPYKFNKPNLMEGVVIRPISQDYYSPVGQIFMIKYKNEKFKDICYSKKKRVLKKLPEELKSILEDAQKYINKNRTQDLFSKYGKLQSMLDFGKYIKYYFDDFFDDFIKDYGADYHTLEKQPQRFFNKEVNKLIVKELKNNL